MTFEIEVGGRTRIVEVRGPEMVLDGQRLYVDAARLEHTWSLIVGPAEAGHYDTHGRSYEVALVQRAVGDLMVHVNGRPVAVRASLSGHGRPQGPALRERGVQTPGTRRSQSGTRADVARHGPQRVVAPMPGRITKVLVKVGDAVAARQGLVVVEAMKMENELRSPRAGTVTQVPAVEGALVEANAVLVVVE